MTTQTVLLPRTGTHNLRENRRKAIFFWIHIPISNLISWNGYVQTPVWSRPHRVRMAVGSYIMADPQFVPS